MRDGNRIGSYKYHCDMNTWHNAWNKGRIEKRCIWWHVCLFAADGKALLFYFVWRTIYISWMHVLHSRYIAIFQNKSDYRRKSRKKFRYFENLNSKLSCGRVSEISVSIFPARSDWEIAGRPPGWLESTGDQKFRGTCSTSRLYLAGLVIFLTPSITFSGRQVIMYYWYSVVTSQTCKLKIIQTFGRGIITAGNRDVFGMTAVITTPASVRKVYIW